MPDSADAGVSRGESPLAMVLYFLLYLSVLVRMLLNTDAVPALPYGLMAAFLALAVAQHALRRRIAATHAYLGVQSLVTVALLLTTPRLDFYALLFIVLSIVAGRDLPNGTDVAWLAGLCLLSLLGLALAFGRQAAFYGPTYVAGCLFVGLFGRATRNAEAARARSEGLRAELEAANQRLHAYAERAEEAAAEQERTHLARDLHDAATQTVFSMNLTAEAARMALPDDPGKAAALIDRLQELAREALAEMRTLVRELRPASVVDEGLTASLQRLAALRLRRDGLSVDLRVSGEEAGSVEVKETVFRTAREALTNVAKHARVRQSRLELSFGTTEVVLRVTDKGVGFDANASRRPESYGLLAMRERVEALGGSFSICSAPGAGTEVEARLPLELRPVEVT